MVSLSLLAGLVCTFFTLNLFVVKVVVLGIVLYCIVLYCIVLYCITKNLYSKKNTFRFSINIIFKFVCGEGACIRYCILLNFIVNN